MCPNVKRVVMAVQCGEAAAPDCAECRQAMADEHAFVAMIQEGLAGVRPRRRIAPLVMSKIRKPRRLVWWPFAAAAVVVVAGFWMWPQPQERKVVVPPVVVKPIVPPPAPIVPETPKAVVVVPPPPPKPVVVEKAPEPTPIVVVEKPPEKVEPVPPPTPPPVVTVAEKPKIEVTITVKSGAVMFKGKKLTGTCSLIEGEEFQVDRATVLERPGMTLHLERGSRGHFEAIAFALKGGEGLIEALGPCELQLMHPIRSALSHGRFIASFKPDAIFIEEGAGRSGEVTLFEGQPYRLGQTIAVDRKVSLKRRPIQMASVWSTAFDKLPAGTIVPKGSMSGGVLKATRQDDGIAAAIHHESNKLFVVRPTTHLRFRYRMSRPAPLMIQLFNRTKGENFRVSIPEPPAGGWVTVTVRIVELQAPADGKAVQVEADDVFSDVQWHVGEAELVVDDVQIVEIK